MALAQVWNATVANLTLMALGSSAPEILLNVIEIFDKQFYAGELGVRQSHGQRAWALSHNRGLSRLRKQY